MSNTRTLKTCKIVCAPSETDTSVIWARWEVLRRAGGNPAAGNLMLPGSQTQAAGTSITESQIQHITQDFSNNKLNKWNGGGGKEPWGTYPTDRPLIDINGNVIKQ